MPAYRILSMDANIERSYWQQALYGKMFGAFAAIALVLAAVGVYGVISYAVSVSARRRSACVSRSARSASDVLRLIVGHGALLGGIGVAIGLVGALAVTRFLRTLLFGVSPFDPASFVGVSLALTAIALLGELHPGATRGEGGSGGGAPVRVKPRRFALFNTFRGTYHGASSRAPARPPFRPVHPPPPE